MELSLLVVVDVFISLPDTTRVLPDGCEFHQGNLRTNAKNQYFLEERTGGCAITARYRHARAIFARWRCVRPSSITPEEGSQTGAGMSRNFQFMWFQSRNFSEPCWDFEF